MFRFLLPVSVTLVLATTTGLFAHSGAKGIVLERMEAMTTIGKSMVAISKMMRGSKSVNASELEDHASLIEIHAGKMTTDYFPAGSMGKLSAAKDTIWQDWEAFSAVATTLKDSAFQMQTHATKLAQNGITPEGKDFVSLFTSMKRTCASCHDAFRSDKD